MANLLKNLPHGESLLFEAKRHWLRYAKANLVILFGILAAISFSLWKDSAAAAILTPLAGNADIPAIDPNCIISAPILIILIGLVWRISLKQIDKGNRMIITTNYIIQSDGIFSSKIKSLSLSHAELINVDQTLMGKILGYGTISVLSNGQVFASARKVANPIRLRNYIMSRKR